MADVARSCVACGADIREGARFCAGCGASLVLACPECGSAAEVGDRFCVACGHPFASVPAPRATGPAQSEPVGELKQVTVLFGDVKGSMDLAEALDAEDWAAVMKQFFHILSEGVTRFGGTVDKFTGDGIMAIFGAPVSQEDHARRACHAALHLTDSIAAYANGLRQSKGIDLHVRIGLNSGEVVVGGMGEEGRLHYTALGHTVGLAQRMESLAEPGQAYLTEHTARLVGAHFALRDTGPVEVKGASGPVGVFVLEGPSRRPTGPGSSAALIGRAEELSALEAALARAEEGRAQVVGVVGEAGLGKSRLCDEFVRSAADRGITVRRAAGVSHARDVPLLPVLELLRAYFDIGDTDSRVDAQQKITGRLLDLDPALDDTLPLLFDFLEVPDPERPPPRLSPDVRLRRILDLLRRVTQRRSQRETLVILLEDLHWFDPQSLDFVEQLIPSFPGTRTLVLTNFRPEFSPPWSVHSYYRQLPLDPLDAGAVGHLLTGLLGEDPSLAHPLRAIVDRTGGNPFFVEEVVRSLVENGTLAGEPGAYHLTRPVDSVGVPPTVQATLAARIDRLAEGDKAVLQMAAVVGRNFTEPVLRLVSRLPGEDLSAITGRLRAGEFIQEVTFDPIEEYRFWHPLTQEVAYAGMLRDRRSALHAAVARAIVATDADRLDERAALVSTHWEQAGDAAEAACWNDRAAAFALRGDVPEAMRRWRATLTHLASAPETDETLRIGIRARNRLIRYGARTGMDLEEAGRLYAEGRAQAERFQDVMQLASIIFAYGSTNFFRGGVRDGLDSFLEGARLSDQADDVESQAGFWSPVALVLTWAGPADALAQAIDRAETVCGGNPAIGASVLGFSPMGALAVARAGLLALRGQFDDARAALDEGLSIGRARGETENIAWVSSTYPLLAHTRDEFEASLERAHDGVRVAEESGLTSNSVLCLGGVGIALLGLGNVAEAVGPLERALAVARHHQVALFEEARLLTNLARARLGLGDGVGARQLATEAVDVARRGGARLLECPALLTRARIHRATGGAPADVEADLAAALDLARATGAIAYEREIEAERR